MRALLTAVVLVLALALPAPVLAADLEVGGAVDVEAGKHRFALASFPAFDRHRELSRPGGWRLLVISNTLPPP